MRVFLDTSHLKKKKISQHKPQRVEKKSLMTEMALRFPDTS